MREFPGPVAPFETAQLDTVPMLLLAVTFHKTAGGLRFVQFYDRSGGPPSGTPEIVIPIVAGDTNMARQAPTPWEFMLGCLVALSTTRTTFTPGGSELWLAANWVRRRLP